jgi:sulfatase maturation enzyme AslB (radical SAM superfamily)
MVLNRIVGGQEMVYDYVYAIDIGNEYLLINSISLERKTIAKNDLFKKSADIEEFINQSSYIERLAPETNFQKIEPTIVTSFDCNYSCTYCYQKEKKIILGRTLPIDVDLIKSFYCTFGQLYNLPLDFGTIHVVGGEPLLPENYDTLCHIPEIWPNNTISITTNGTFLIDYSDYINRNNVKVKISIDGTKEMHMKRRLTKQNDAYNKTINGLEMLIESKIDTTIMTVFNPENVEGYSKFFDQLETMGWLHVPNLSLAFIPEVGCGCDDMPVEDVLESLSAFSKLKQLDGRTKHVDARK